MRVPERLVETGASDRGEIEGQAHRLLERGRRPRGGRYEPVAVDDSKLHRTSKKV